MTMYADYVRERTFDKIMETDYGFATYRYVNEGKAVYIVDIYVDPAYRKQNIASEMAGRIVEEAKTKGAVELFGTVVPSMKGSTDSMKVLMAYGMKVSGTGNDLIVFKKEI